MTIEIYQDAADLWRWRARARNGRLVAESGESYTSRSNVERALRSLARGLMKAYLSTV